MRIAFVKALTEIAEKDPDVILVTGDLGFSVYEDFQTRFPEQYLNAGVAEQNLTGVAAGLALEGKKPIMYSIVPFITMRNYEQIRNDICYQNQNVKVVGVGAGFSYGIYGHTHYGLEDIALMKTLPNMTIFSPGDPIEVAWAVRESMRRDGPCYIRLGKAGEPIVHTGKPALMAGRGMVLREGKDLTIFATGVLLPRAIEVAERLETKGFTTRVVSMHTIVPLDTEIILDSAKKTRALCTLEEHFVEGGLGSSVAQVIAERWRGNQVLFKKFGVEHKYYKTTGSQEFMRSQTGLTTDQLVLVMEQFLSSH